MTWTEGLLQKLQILSPELEYCAIVTDDVETAKKICMQVSLSQNLIYPFYELKECIKNFYYDYILCVDNGWSTAFLNFVQKCDVPKDRIVALNFPSNENFLLERSLSYFKEHATEFEIFATGMSYAEVGLDVTQFKRPTFNFARSSQDLYYNFQTAKFAIKYANRLRYALIGLAAYSFHYDLSKSANLQFLMLHYLIAFNDLHNFPMPVELYRKFLSEEYLSLKMPLESFDLNNPFHTKQPLCFMTPQAKFSILQKNDGGKGKDFQETRDENIKILDEYLTLCEENSIFPIIFLMPLSQGYMKYYNKWRLDELRYLVEKACIKHSSAIFVDAWRIDVFTDEDFYDYGHMNLLGAAKFSAFLNRVIESLD